MHARQLAKLPQEFFIDPADTIERKEMDHRWQAQKFGRDRLEDLVGAQIAYATCLGNLGNSPAFAKKLQPERALPDFGLLKLAARAALGRPGAEVPGAPCGKHFGAVQMIFFKEARDMCAELKSTQRARVGIGRFTGMTGMTGMNCGEVRAHSGQLGRLQRRTEE